MDEIEKDPAIIYGLELNARALAAQSAETELVRFLVGTQGPSHDNQVLLIDFDEESDRIASNAFQHNSGEIWHISASATHKDLFATSHRKAVGNAVQHGGTVWKLPDFDLKMEGQTPMPLEEAFTLGTDDTDPLLNILWHPTKDSVLTLTPHEMQLWDINTGQSSATATAKAKLAVGEGQGAGPSEFNACRWNPHHNCSFAVTADGSTLRGWDLRTMEETFTKTGAHYDNVRSLDFNPNKQYNMATCGDDGTVKFWDTRDLSMPLLTMASHSHWVWSVRYNQFHDQLILSSSSDSQVVLSNVASLSSDLYGDIDVEEDEDAEAKKPLPDGRMTSYEHEDSVYAVEWSAADPWIFASLSYDGRLVVNKVPKSIKYQILL